MAQLRQDFAEFVKRDTAVVVVGPDDAAAFSRYWARNNLPFVGLPDPGHTVLKAYGQEIKLFKFGRMPAQVLVDRSGTARFVHYGRDMTDIPTTAENLEAIDALNAEGQPAAPDSGD
jgi:peroxiredoxin